VTGGQAVVETEERVSKTLGEFEQLVLFALVALGDTAYGASVRREIESRTGRPVSAGAVYTVLERLESNDLVSSWVGDPSPERGGRRKKHYRLKPAGAALLRQARDELLNMSRGLDARLDRIADQA
jgi:DNA-binding PadR family transcriptional regulator